MLIDYGVRTAALRIPLQQGPGRCFIDPRCVRYGGPQWSNVHAVEDETAEPTVERAHVAVPEHSHPGESQSNGLAESAMKELIDQVRTLKMSLEYKLKSRLPNNHAVMAWLVEHAAYMINRCKLGTDGRTACGRLHGKESTA